MASDEMRFRTQNFSLRASWLIDSVFFECSSKMDTREIKKKFHFPSFPSTEANREPRPDGWKCAQPLWSWCSNSQSRAALISARQFRYFRWQARRSTMHWKANGEKMSSKSWKSLSLTSKWVSVGNKKKLEVLVSRDLSWSLPSWHCFVTQVNPMHRSSIRETQPNQYSSEGVVIKSVANHDQEPELMAWKVLLWVWWGIT